MRDDLERFDSILIIHSAMHQMKKTQPVIFSRTLFAAHVPSKHIGFPA